MNDYERYLAQKSAKSASDQKDDAARKATEARDREAKDITLQREREKAIGVVQGTMAKLGIKEALQTLGESGVVKGGKEVVTQQDPYAAGVIMGITGPRELVETWQPAAEQTGGLGNGGGYMSKHYVHDEVKLRGTVADDGQVIIQRSNGCNGWSEGVVVDPNKVDRETQVSVFKLLD
jgi:hypothetical protein